MKDELSEKQTDAILKALDDALKEGPWDDSNFLRVIGKNLREIRDGFANQLNSKEQEKAKLASNLANRVALRSGQKEIFIALYSFDGSNLQSWERIIINLPKQTVSRPIYENEEDIRAIIKTKENKNNEGFVSIYVNQSDILPMTPDKTPVDKLGKPLLTLKDKVLSLDNINYFAHVTGTYQLAQGRLIKNTPSE
jgi:intracellular multiplication protein IcmQ